VDIHGWEERYRSGERRVEDLDAAPTPLLIETAKQLPAGNALDLACGAGRNALWLAEHGWQVTAIDGAPAAIQLTRDRAFERGVRLHARVADLEAQDYVIESSAWDLIAICYYLHRDLFEPAKRGVKPGGVLIAIVHIAEGTENPTPTRLRRGELEAYFHGWEILHRYEGASRDPAHKRPVSEIVARRPALEH
jgi:SAM-dependent methyltransferase